MTTIHLARRQVDAAWLSGEDRLAFLARMSTAGLTDLEAGQGRATAVLTDTGRVVDLVSVYAGTDGALLVSSGPGGAAAVVAHLRRYILYNDRARATDASGQVEVLRLWTAPGTAGPEKGLEETAASADDLAAMLSRATGLDVPTPLEGRWLIGSTEDEEVWVLGHVPLAGLGGVPTATRVAVGCLGGADVVVPVASADAMAARLEAAAGELGIRHKSATPADYAAARIQAALPAFGAEIDGSSNPLELGLKDAIDFGKGCYIGQEIVARLDTYEKVQRKLVRVEIRGPVAAGDRLDRQEYAERAGGRGMGVSTTKPAKRGGRDVAQITTVAEPAREGEPTPALALVPVDWGP